MSGPPNRGGAVAGCPKNKANIWACVTQMGTVQPVSGVKVELRGPTPGVAMSGPDGYVRFSGVNPGDYTLVVTPAQGAHQEISPYNQALAVGKGQTQLKNVEVFTVGDLRVEVYDDQVPPRPVLYARISADGVSNQLQPRANSHLHPFLRIPSGVYRVGADPTTPDHGPAAGTVQAVVPAGGSVTARVILPAVNVVTPRIALTALGAPRKPDEVLFLPAPRRQDHVNACATLNPVPAAAADDLMSVRLSLNETLPGKAFTGHGALTWGEAGLAVFSDAAGTAALASGAQFPKAQLAAGHTVYVRGASAGTKNLMLTLGGAPQPGVTLQGPATQVVRATEVGLVKPVIAVESQIVVRDRDDLRGHEQAPGGQALVAKPTWVDLSIQQDGGALRYAGQARLKGSGRAAMFSDEACTTAFDASQPLAAARLMGGTPLRIWLRGKHRGTFKLELELDDPADVRLAFVPKVVQDMVCVRPEIKLHHFNPANMPTVAGRQGPIATYHSNLETADLSAVLEVMTDQQKIAEGRLLHLQNDDGHHGRAKLLIEALDAAHWPAYTDDAELVLSVLGEGDAAPKGPDLKLFDAEQDGNEIPLPARWTVATLKGADKTLWVQASGRSKAWRDVALNLSVEKGDFKRAHAEWARFTAVQVKEVKFKVEVTGSHRPEVWYERKKRWYVNVDANARNLRDDATKGRTVAVTAQIEPKLQGVRLHFMLAGEGDHRAANTAGLLPNWEWGNLDAAVKETDRAAADALLNVHADTDAQGLAKCNDLVLSRFGGDKFQIGAYITQDAHLAKYVPGHAQLGLRKPVLTEDKRKIEVWRRVFVQLTAARWSILPSRSVHYEEFKRHFLKVTEVTEKRFSKSSIPGLQEHPKWQFEPGTGTSKVICVGSHNKPQFEAMFTAATDDHKPKGHLILVDKQWDPAVSRHEIVDSPTRTTTISFADTSGTSWVGIFDPPLAAPGATVDMVAPNSNIWRWTDGAGTLHDGWLRNADVKIRKSRANHYDAEVTAPDRCGNDCACGVGGVAIAPTGALQVHFEVALAAAAGPYAGESGSPGSPHCLIVVDKNTGRFNNTIAHELGHMFTMVRSAGGGAQRASYFGAPPHPNWYEKRGGVGNHCSINTTPDVNAVDQDGNAVLNGGTCVMYHVAVGNTGFCDNCKTDIRVQNLEDFFH